MLWKRSLRAATLLGLALSTPPLAGAIIPVTTAADSTAVDAAVTLREALLSVNRRGDLNADVAAARTGTYGDADTVTFAIGSGPATISPLAPLPTLLRAAHLDGSTQPGWIDAPLVTLDGTLAGAGARGLAVADGGGLTALALDGFAGDGLVVLSLVFYDDFESGDQSAWFQESLHPAPLVATGVVVEDSGGRGMVVHPATDATLAGGRIARSFGVGLEIRGRLDATGVEIAESGGHGVLVETGEPVALRGLDVHGSGQHPGGPFPGRAGVLALRTAPGLPPDESGNHHFGLSLLAGTGFASGQIRDNSGDGVVLGDPDLQSGGVDVLVSDQIVHGNQVGIRVRQRDADTFRTASSLASNNVFDNVAGGVHLSTSSQRGLRLDLPAVIGNDVHHNAVAGTGCSALTADQSASQVVFLGPVAASAEQIAACGAPGIDTLNECVALADPESVLSNGVVTECLWTGSTCEPAWGFGGREEGFCASDRNRIFAYVNDPIEPPETQRGIAALDGALVRARFDIWGAGGPDNGTYAEGVSAAGIDAGNDCGSVSTCP